ncbi:hypothetical protein QFZ31_006388 [Neobacillus niacini]|uniref:hypothetical protein n=1 Tax=Neobacillus driksii TaxID=3035913 RepID=UPI00278006F0|nr:hypothetical protein [Neobacillus niacini]MDQ0976510.1 hypothetical protein [Neobacillus niacini]
MEIYRVKSGIRVLMRAFFDEEHKDGVIALATMELFFDLGLFNNNEVVAKAIEELGAFALLKKMSLFDTMKARTIEKLLKGY